MLVAFVVFVGLAGTGLILHSFPLHFNFIHMIT
uniref:Uncharacterized protein n=1 Tax=Anguilla anguilla TaxID=7936 RepID=A0A0E9TU69_ANGAN